MECRPWHSDIEIHPVPTPDRTATAAARAASPSALRPPPPAMDMCKKILPMLLIGVTLTTPAVTDQLEGDEPTEGARRTDVPEVVLQLKYTNGGLNKIYLTQFRHPSGGETTPVSDRSALCSDLCHAGLGGAVCGATCPKMMPVGLQSALSSDNDTAVQYGQPRVGVCPTLCDNHLGQPLCPCGEAASNNQGAIDWSGICDVFCTDGYLLTGCPACSSETRTVSVAAPAPSASLLAARVLNTPAGWNAWCDVQCRQGHGGAACNCDRTPF